MNMNMRQTAWVCVVLAAVFSGWLFSGSALAQSAAQPATGSGTELGVITGDNVYVRSGFSTNYYPVTKLNRGKEVTVVGTEFGWLKILPPGARSASWTRLI